MEPFRSEEISRLLPKVLQLAHEKPEFKTAIAILKDCDKGTSLLSASDYLPPHNAGGAATPYVSTTTTSSTHPICPFPDTG